MDYLILEYDKAEMLVVINDLAGRGYRVIGSLTFVGVYEGENIYACIMGKKV